MTVVMISIGGITRMTRSGLSIVEWKPISGFIPPLSEEQWNQQFELYKQSPEFQQVNSHFEMSDYKKIFFWEYFHRLWGRLIFFVAFFAGLVLVYRKKLEIRVVLISSALVALQGLIGWVMVKSGLNQDPLVSPYLLVIHFLSANVVLLYLYFEFKKLQDKIILEAFHGRAKKLFYVLGGLILAQVIYGGLVSGFRAGHSFNTWPLMGGDFFPMGGLRLSPIVLNLFENPATIQWVHRWLAFSIILFLILFSRSLGSEKQKIKNQIRHMHATVGLQILLGILNIVFAVPIFLAAAHQLVAVFIIMGYANILFKVQKE